jgi:hypothetical protein
MYEVFGENDLVRYTQSKDGKTKFIFLMDYPKEQLILHKLKLNKNDKLSFLGSEQKLKWQQTSAGIEIMIPATEKKYTTKVWVIKVTAQ